MKKLFKKRWDKHYHSENKNRYWHLVIDSALAIILIGLIVTNIYISNNYGSVLGIQHEVIINEIENENNSNATNTDNDNNDVATSTEDKITDPTQEEKPEPTKPKTTNIELKSFARYYTSEGEQLGIGPIPPVVGEPTNYWIFISIGNFNHDLENVEISATLPSNVSSTGDSSVTWGNNIEIVENKISWELGDLKIENEELIAAAFEVEIIPTDDQIGSATNLLEDISITATDLVTKKEITKHNPVITTNIKDSSGVVIN